VRGRHKAAAPITDRAAGLHAFTVITAIAPDAAGALERMGDGKRRACARWVTPARGRHMFKAGFLARGSLRCFGFQLYASGIVEAPLAAYSCGAAPELPSGAPDSLEPWRCGLGTLDEGISGRG